MTYPRLAFAAAGLLLLAACREQTAPTTTAPAAPQAAAPAGPQCYAYTSARDTVRLTLATTQPTVTGQLSYRYFEKDRNEGTIRGAMHGDTLRAEYTFQSEGVASVREVAFLRRGTGFVEGYGDVAERAGAMVFKQPGALKFTSTQPLSPVTCPK
ncbi:hypothetical protein [Hymenobacter bucti]|uniref:Uncharacterized protein n=1 Tax=Hymenobacter bucti TaxID=1844114 RepID=A0ABW4R104_9BACT